MGGRRRVGREPTARPKCTGGYLNTIDARLHDLSDDRSDVELFPPFCGLSAVTPLLVTAYYSRREIQYGESATFDSSCGQIVPRITRNCDPTRSVRFSLVRRASIERNEKERERRESSARAHARAKSRGQKNARERAHARARRARFPIFSSLGRYLNRKRARARARARRREASWKQPRARGRHVLGVSSIEYRVSRGRGRGERRRSR